MLLVQRGTHLCRENLSFDVTFCMAGCSTVISAVPICCERRTHFNSVYWSQYQIEITNRFAALGNISDNEDINRAW